MSLVSEILINFELSSLFIYVYRRELVLVLNKLTLPCKLITYVI